MTRPERCERCHAAPAAVGWGQPPEWLCLDCFGDALGEVQRMVTDLARETGLIE